MLKEWAADNWEKVLTSLLTVAGAMWAAWRRFSGRIETLEARVAALEAGSVEMKREQAEMRKEQAEVRAAMVAGLDKIEEKLGGVVELKIFVERNDVMLSQVLEDIRELREDVKTLMRG